MMRSADEVTTFTVVGCGLIGASWAALASAVDLTVPAWNADPAVTTEFMRRVSQAKSQLADLGMNGTGKISIASSLEEAVSQSDWIQENAPEKLALKRDLLREIEDLSTPHSIIASSTSSFLW